MPHDCNWRLLVNWNWFSSLSPHHNHHEGSSPSPTFAAIKKVFVSPCKNTRVPTCLGVSAGSPHTARDQSIHLCLSLNNFCAGCAGQGYPAIFPKNQP